MNATCEAVAESLERTSLMMEKVLTSDPGNPSGVAPLGHAVLVAPYEPELKAGSIVIPENVQASMQAVNQRAIVVAIGPTAWADEPCPRAKVGDKVLVTKYAGYVTTQTKDKKLYRIVNDRDIFARLDWED